MINQDLNRAKATVEMLLDMSDNTHNDLIIDLGNHWIEESFNGYPVMITTWKHSPTFWSWWAHQWNLRNYEMLHQMGFAIDESETIRGLVQEALQEAFDEKHCSSIFLFPQKPLITKISQEKKRIYE